MLDTLYSQLGAIVWLGICAFALLKGDRPERMAGGALVIAWLATLAVHRDTNLTSVTIPVFLIDVALLALLIGLSWRSDRNWPVWAAAFQSIVVLVHVVTLVDLRIRAIAYLTAQTVGTYGVLICLAVGTFWAWQTREAIRPREDDLH